MKKFNLRSIALFLVLVLFAGCFAGCGNGDTSSVSSNGSSVVTEVSSDEVSSQEASSEEASSGNVTSSAESSSKPVSSAQSSSKPVSSVQSSSKPVSSAESSSKPVSSEISSEPEEPTNVFDVIDFTVEVKAGKEPVVLQLSDTQIIDSAQQRKASRLSANQVDFWATNNMDERCFDYLDETINAVKPDLILLTGDLTYGEFDDAGTSMQALIKHLDSFKIPWAPIIGNHEGETEKGIDWYAQQLENSKYCLFKQNQEYNGNVITGNGNYTVGIKQGGKLTRVFFMLDSNGYTNMSLATRTNGHSTGTAGFAWDQQLWYKDVIADIKRLSPSTKLSFAYHIQMQAFEDAFDRYGLKGAGLTGPVVINIDTASNKQAGDYGYIGAKLADEWDLNREVYNDLKAAGVDSMFVGHVHRNNAGVKYDGMYFVYGQKSSTYDAFLVEKGGSITGGYPPMEGTPRIGGTVIKLSASGAITDINNYICKNAGSAK